MDRIDLQGKVAVVTGGASGIGLATVTRLAEEGAHVVIADLNVDDGERIAKEIEGRFVALDVSKPAEWARLVDVVGPINLAYLNAGVTTQEGDVTALTDDQYRRIMGPNVDGVVFGTRALTPVIEANGGGAIVATASMAGLISFAMDPIYTMTKHAVVGFVRAVAPQLQAKGISINAICPGVVDTPLVGEAREQLRAAGFPMIDPADVADAVVHAITSGDTGQAYMVRVSGREPFPFTDPPAM